jgi:hypothetical protein
MADTEHLHEDWPLARQYGLTAELLAYSQAWEKDEGGIIVATKGAPETHLSVPVNRFAKHRTVGGHPNGAHAPRCAVRVDSQHKRNWRKRWDWRAGGRSYSANAYFDVASLIRPDHNALRAGRPCGRVTSSAGIRHAVCRIISFA